MRNLNLNKNNLMKIIPTVPKKALILIAGAVWFIAGFNIMHIGTPDMIASWNSPLLPLIFAVVVFFLFTKFVFYKMVIKHSKRIMSFEEEKVVIHKFFDKKSYLIMAFMITFGVLLRKSGIVPDLYLGTFYTGLGASLISAGLFFFFRFFYPGRRIEAA